MTLQKRRLHGSVRPTVLIVDGDALYRWFVSEALAAGDVHVVQCPTATAAIEFLRRRLDADLVLVDARTLEGEGRAVLDLFQVASRGLPCVLFDSSEHDALAPSGDVCLVEKPVDSSELIALVEQQLHGVARR